MIVTELYNGQGLGNQLWSYVVTRTVALDLGFEYGIMHPEKFKGSNFLSLDFGRTVIGGTGPEGGPPSTLPEEVDNYYIENDTWYDRYKCDIRNHDSNLLKIKDKTKIDGYFQSEDFILHRRDEIKGWLKVYPQYDCYDFCHDDICIVNVRGGEYKSNKELILDINYWHNAIENMKKINGQLDFVIVTDDTRYAKSILPQYKSIHFDIGKDYSILKNARYLILSNSSFSFFPAWTSATVRYVIAPKYWARHNISDGFWACAFNIYRDWMWQDRSGRLFDYSECIHEYSGYSVAHQLDRLQKRPSPPPQSFVANSFRRILNAASLAKRNLTGR